MMKLITKIFLELGITLFSLIWFIVGLNIEKEINSGYGELGCTIAIASWLFCNYFLWFKIPTKRQVTK